MIEKLPNWKGGDRHHTIDAIVKNARIFGFCQSQTAYILATVQHETGNTFLPVREGFNVSDAWRSRNFRYYPYYGRGYVQLTWFNNYEKYTKLLGLDLVSNPDLAMRPDISLFILLHGMKYGTFTGVSLNNYTRNGKCDFINARRVINGMDRAQLIAGYARSWMPQIL
jgi:predicted chitinase